jgi:hypothetical protein
LLFITRQHGQPGRGEARVLLDLGHLDQAGLAAGALAPLPIETTLTVIG